MDDVTDRKSNAEIFRLCAPPYNTSKRQSPSYPCFQLYTRTPVYTLSNLQQCAPYVYRQRGISAHRSRPNPPPPFRSARDELHDPAFSTHIAYRLSPYRVASSLHPLVQIQSRSPSKRKAPNDSNNQKPTTPSSPKRCQQALHQTAPSTSTSMP